MNPAFSVIFLTTLIGIGQGLFVAMFIGQIFAKMEALPPQPDNFYVYGSVLSLLFLVAGLFASFFHLGHPERAWRAASQWRTSWLSREVIALPFFMLLVFVFGVLHYFEYNPNIFGTTALPHGELITVVGILGLLACLALFVCTGMIYACLKFLQEWNSPLTVINYILFGMVSGYTFATLYAMFMEASLLSYFTTWTVILTITALVFRGASLVRNSKIKRKSTIRSAIGVRHTHIQQKAQGSMGGSFNTKEFFHGKKPVFMKNMKWIFLTLVFPIPIFLMFIGLTNESLLLVASAFAIQYIGLIAERWFFFAQANHPQNLYYQTIS